MDVKIFPNADKEKEDRKIAGRTCRLVEKWVRIHTAVVSRLQTVHEARWDMGVAI